MKDSKHRENRASSCIKAATLGFVLLGVVLRFTGIGWGLPFNLHVDENQGSLHEPPQIEWKFAHQGWPESTLASYGALPAYLHIGLRHWLLGHTPYAQHVHDAPDAHVYTNHAFTHGPSDGTQYHWPDVTLLVRATSATFYSLALIVLVLIARRLWGDEAALATAIFSTAQPAIIQHAHFGTLDGWVVLGTAMLLHACLRIAAHGKWRDYMYAWGGLLIASNAKLTAAVFAIFVILAAYERTPSMRHLIASGRLWFVFTMFPVSWLVLNPTAALRPAWYFYESPISLFELARVYRRGGPLSDWALFYDDKPITYVLTQVLPDGMGLLNAMFSLIALGFVLVSERGTKRWPALFALLAFWPFLSTQLHTIRYLLPAFGFLALAQARTFMALWERVRASRTNAWRVLGVGALTLAVVGGIEGTAYAIGMSALHVGEENRVAAARWIANHVEPGDVVAIQDHPMYRPPLRDDWRVGSSPDIRQVPIHILWNSNRDGVHTGDARFIAVNEWELRMIDVPRYVRTFPQRSEWLSEIRAHGAPRGYRPVAQFDRRPSFLFFTRDESQAEIFSFAFDHLPIYVFERESTDVSSDSQ